jgi:hypothetical protein
MTMAGYSPYLTVNTALTVTHVLTWTVGALIGPGWLVSEGDLRLSNKPNLAGGNLDNRGAATLSSGILQAYKGAHIHNAGTFNLVGNSVI